LLINVAAFGSQKYMTRVLDLAQKFPELKITPFIYQTPEECPQLVKESQNFDLLFFTGIIPYSLSYEEALKKNLPMTHIKFDDLNIALTLLQLQDKFNKNIHDIRLSLDIPGADNIKRVLEELYLSSANIHIKDYSNLLKNKQNTFITDEFVDYHQNLWQSGKIEAAITSIAAVEDRLKKIGVPCLSTPMPEKSIINALTEASSLGNLYFNKGMQITIGFIYIPNFPEEKSIEIKETLTWFSEEIDASLQYLGHGLFIMYLTRNSLEYATNFYRDLYIISNINKQFSAEISFGFGLGLTTKEAERNAQKALNYSLENSGNCCFVVSNDDKIIGPINKGVRNYTFKTDNKRHLQLSEETGISIVNLSKIFEFLKLRKNRPFTSLDLAIYLKVSQRSSERFIKKLVDNGYFQIAGTESAHQKGRPRSLYIMNINRFNR